MNHVAYKGEAPMVQDLIGGQIQMAYASALVAKPHIEAGKLKAIGVTGERRIAHPAQRAHAGRAGPEGRGLSR